MRKILISIISLTLLGAVSCIRTHEPESEKEAIVDLVSLMSEYKGLDSNAQADSLSKYRHEITAFFKTLSEDSLSEAILQAWSGSLAVEKFTPVVDSVFPSLVPVEQDLGHIITEAKSLGLEIPRRRYAAVVYGRPESILFVDSVMLIAMNHFLGAEFDGYSHWPVYRRLEKTPENLPYSIAEAIVGTAYPYRATGSKSTLLSRMLYEGALARAKMLLVNDATVENVLGYNATDLKWLVDNEKEIWRQLVSRHLLYDTSELTIDRLIAPAPTIREAETQWPGRTGRYIGYRIVEEYCRNHKEATLSYLLSPEFYCNDNALKDSGY